ncbi:MAG TPA: PAS domain S-box protein, partial [Candidatus Acidoferrum sp.]|nr:PAS domain S-box protein [Candidatus Acidoferrum sp.]
GEVEFLFFSSIDVTERRRAEEAVLAREREFRSLAENTPDLIVRWNRDLRRVYVNPAFAAAAGGDSRRSITSIEEKLVRVLATGRAEALELPWLTESGPRFFHLQLVPEIDQAGALASVLGIGRDITSLKENERRFLTLTEHSPDVIMRYDQEGRYTYVNSAIERILGMAPQEFIGRRAGEVPSERLGRAVSDDFLSLRQKIDQVLTTGVPTETELHVLLPGAERMFNVRLIPERDETGRVTSVLNVSRDITESKRAEEALRASEQRFRQVTENIDEVFWLTDVGMSEMIYISPAYERVWGRTCESLHARPISWMEAVHPEDQARVREAVLRLRVDGTYNLEYRIVRPDGAVRWIRDRAFPIADAGGRVYRIAGVAEDVTARRQLEEQLQQSQKMDAIGQLAGGIAHDFNNMLVVIQLQASLLAEAESGAELKEGVQQILAATERASNLTRQLLTFSRREVRQVRNIDLGEVSGAMVALLRRLLGEDIALETHFAPGLPLVSADPGMMEQVVMNLAVNARDAMPAGGRLAISLDPVTVDEAHAAAHPQAASGRYVCLGVSDSGSGIAPENLSRIFEPFFTTKEVGRGTGLGLATVFGIVQQHQGWIEVTSEVGRGTAFRVFLPALEPSAVESADAAAAQVSPGGSETILLVEDDAAVRKLARVVLDRCGYRVLEADSGAAALALWAARTAPVDLLFTDLVMPGGMSGQDLAAEMMSRQPGLKVVYTSGYTNDILNRRLRLEPGRNFLQKPYPAHELAATVRRCLDAPRAPRS